MIDRPTRSLLVIDAAVLTGLGLLAASPLGDAYGGGRWLIAAGGGLVLGVTVAAVSMMLRWGPWLTAVLLTAVYFVAGPALALPDTATAGVLPNLTALGDLADGIVHAWRDSLTLVTPLGSSGSVLIVPLVIGLVGGVSAATVLWRSRWPGASALVVIAVFVASAAFGSSLEGRTLVRGAALVIGLLVWTRWRAMRHVRASWPRRMMFATLTLAIAGGAGLGLASATSAPDSREVLRDHVDPPFDPRDYPSPLARFRAFTDKTNLKDATLFTVEGLDVGSRVRIATMDTFDGIVWNVTGGAGLGDASGTFARVGSRPAAASAVDVSVTINELSGVWVPSIGETQRVTVTDGEGRVDGTRDVAVLHNDVTGTVAQVGGVTPGTTYEYQIVLPKAHSEEEIAAAARSAGVSLPPPAGVPEALAKLAEKWSNEGDVAGADGALVTALARHLRDDGFYSDGKPAGYPSAAGHGIKRMTDLVANPREMVGNDEQYASALGIAAQNLGLPARVVIGAVVPAGGVVRGDDVHAWVEVSLAGLGWVPFASTPPDTQTLKLQQEEPDPTPQPYIPQPPQLPEEPQDAEQAPPQGAGGLEDNSELAGLLGKVLGYVVDGLKIVLLLSPIWGLLLIKRVRRRRRRRAPDPLTRLSGGWREVTDRARDLGTRLPHSNTRFESSVVLTERYPDSQASALATRADRHVFGPSDPTQEEVDAYWRDVDSALKRMRKSVAWWRRPIAVFSPASIPWRHVRAGAGVRVKAAGQSAAKSKPGRWVSRMSGVARRRVMKMKMRWIRS